MDSLSPSAPGDGAPEKPESALAVVPPAVLTVYRQKEHWLEEVDPTEFLLAHHCLTGAPSPVSHIRETRTALIALLAGLVLLVAILGLGHWRITTYLHDLFAPAPPPAMTKMGDFPTRLAEAEIPMGVRDDFRAINRSIDLEAWSEAVTRAESVAADARRTDLLRTNPRALEWLYEVLVAGRMAPKHLAKDAPAAASAAYRGYRARVPEAKPSFRLQYNHLLALFEQAGGIGPISGERNALQESLLRDIAQLEGDFGKELSAQPDRAGKVRVVLAFTLCRLLDPVPKTALTTEGKLDPVAVKRWDELHDLLAAWRAGLGNERRKWPSQLLACEAWFWQRAESFTPQWWQPGHEVKIGLHLYETKVTQANLEATNEALRAQAAGS